MSHKRKDVGDAYSDAPPAKRASGDAAVTAAIFHRHLSAAANPLKQEPLLPSALPMAAASSAQRLDHDALAALFLLSRLGTSLRTSLRSSLK